MSDGQNKPKQPPEPPQGETRIGNDNLGDIVLDERSHHGSCGLFAAHVADELRAVEIRTGECSEQLPGPQRPRVREERPAKGVFSAQAVVQVHGSSNTKPLSGRFPRRQRHLWQVSAALPHR